MANSGEMTPPCGVPVREFLPPPTVRFEDRLDDQLDRHLSHPVPDRQYPQAGEAGTKQAIIETTFHDKEAVMVEQLLTRYRDRLAAVLSCYDRIIMTGILLGACYATGMTSFFHTHQIRIFDDARFAEPLWNRIREQARKLAVRKIGYTMADNAFIRIDDWEQAQQLADGFSPDELHHILDRYARLCCPVLDVFEVCYHWSLMQVEYSTDGLSLRADHEAAV